MRFENLLLTVALLAGIYLAFTIPAVSYFPGKIKAGRSHGTWQEGVLEFRVYSLKPQNCTVNVYRIANSGSFPEKNVKIRLRRGENLIKINLTLHNGTNRVSYDVECS